MTRALLFGASVAIDYLPLSSACVGVAVDSFSVSGAASRGGISTYRAGIMV